MPVPSQWISTFVLTSAAAGCFYAAMLAPVADRSRALLAVGGVIFDWIPVVAGWMLLPEAPSAALWWIHVGFGAVGYAVLLYCVVGWVRNRPRDLRVRVAFLAIWTPAYLAGVAMTLVSSSVLPPMAATGVTEGAFAGATALLIIDNYG